MLCLDWAVATVFPTGISIGAARVVSINEPERGHGS
jgi:hypothetical protein